MTKKHFFLFFVLILVFISSIFIVSAHFPPAHIASTIKATNTQPQTEYKRICAENLEICLAFTLCGPDSTVVHYLSTSGKEIYRGTHVKKAVDKCFQCAGNDEQLRAGCIGWGLHETQDPISHEGYTPKTIKSYFSTNLIMHPIAERKVSQNLVNAISNNEVLGLENVDMDSLERNNCKPFSQDPKYLKLLQCATGMDLSNDVAIVDTALKGEGRYAGSNVWGKSIDLPDWWYYLSGGALALGLIMFLLIAFKGRRFKKTLMILYGLIALVFGILLLSLLLGTSYIWYNSLADVLGVVVSESDWKAFFDESVSKSTQYLNDGVLRTIDASGLSHWEGDKYIVGALNAAETNGIILLTVLASLFSIVLLILTIVAFKGKKR